MRAQFTVAIDGPVAAGKTTVGRHLASRITALFFDTGMLYRAVAHAVLNHQIPPDAEDEVARIAESISIDLQQSGEDARVIVDGCDITDELRSPEIDRVLPSISANPDVRRHLLEVQRDIARGRRSVVVGRDIGTVVLPDADLKIYLDAEPDIRATRRYDELRERGVEISWKTVRRDLVARDGRDTSREHAPLTKAADAVTVDASNRSVSEVIDAIVELVVERGGLN
ncbi:(d)CMP kinase [soil metagenome]